MRITRLLALVLLLAGCTRDNALAISDDGGNCVAGCDLAGVPIIDGGGHDLHHGKPVDLSLPADDLSGGMQCVSACNHCFTGVCCAGGVNGCCGAGEWCDSSGQCRCGQGAACPSTQTCASGGPAPGPGTGQCGVICCGGGTPCPL